MSNHDQLAQAAERMRNNFKDYLDQPNHSHATNVMRDINELISDLKGKKGRDAVDARLRAIMDNVKRLDQEIIDVHHSSAIAGLCEQMRREAAKL